MHRRPYTHICTTSGIKALRTDWLEFNGTFSTKRLYRAFKSLSSV